MSMECLARAGDRPHTMARWAAPAEERGVSRIFDGEIAGGYGAAIVHPRLGHRSFRRASCSMPAV